MFLLEVYDIYRCWSTFGVYSSREEVELARTRVTEAYEQKFQLMLKESDFQIKEVEMNQDMLKRIGL